MYSPEQIEEKFSTVLSYIEEGSSVASILAKGNSIVSRSEFECWLREDEDKKSRYARACEIRAEKLFEEILDIADDGSNDFMTITKGDTSYEVENKEWVNRSKLRVDARKWILAKMNPKKYGEKVTLAGDEENPIKVITGMNVT